MSTKNFVAANKIVPALPQDTGTGERTGATIDLADAKSVAFVVTFGAMAADVTLQVQGGNLADGSDMGDLVDASLTVAAAADSIAAIEVSGSFYRYHRLKVTKTGSTAESAVAYVTNIKTEPAALESGVSAKLLLVGEKAS